MTAERKSEEKTRQRPIMMTNNDANIQAYMHTCTPAHSFS